jgi:hypothetical protein
VTIVRIRVKRGSVVASSVHGRPGRDDGRTTLHGGHRIGLSSVRFELGAVALPVGQPGFVATDPDFQGEVPDVSHQRGVQEHTADISSVPPDQFAPLVVGPAGARGLERDRLRVYELSLAPGESTGTVECFSSLTVFLTIATVLTRLLSGGEHIGVHAPGDVIWMPGPVSFSLTNVGEEPYRAAVGEWR